MLGKCSNLPKNGETSVGLFLSIHLFVIILTNIINICMNENMKRGIQCQISEKLELSPSYLNDIIHGRVNCPSKLAVRLEQLTGIDRVIWVWGTPEEIKKALDETYPGSLDRAQKKGSEHERSDALPHEDGRRQVLGLFQTLGRGAMSTLTRP